MNNANGGQSCPVKCWTVAGVIGVLVAIMAIAVAGKSIFAGLILGILAAVLLGFLFNWLFCADVPAIGASTAAEQPVDSSGRGAGVAGAAGVAVAGASAAKPATEAPTTPSPAPSSVTTATESDDVTATKADDSKVDAAEASDDASDVASETSGAVKPSKALAGEADLAERKGEWSYDSDAASSDASADAKRDDASADKPVAAENTGDDDAAPASNADARDGGNDATETVVKPSTELPGQADLAARKGTWRYEGGDKSDAKASSPAVETEAVAKPTAPEEPAAAASQEPTATEAAPVAKATASKDQGEDYDGDGVKEGTDEGTKPDLLEAPLEGGPDNLKEIKGIGPKLEKVCHSLGVYHFSQIAAWTEDEVAWANANLVGFKGRVTRDNWVEQAKILAAGGETEFSKRVDKGGVY